MNGKRIVVGLAAGALLMGGTLWSGNVYAWGGHHGGVGMEAAMPVVAMVKAADLSQDQKHQVANILTNHKAAIESKTASASDARRAVVTAMAANVVDANALATAYDNAAVARKALALEWAQVRTEVQALLTPQQVSDLQVRRDKFMAKMDARHAKAEEHRGDRLDKWIERLSK